MALLMLLAAGWLVLTPEMSWSGGPNVNVTGTVFFGGSVPPVYAVPVSVDRTICGVRSISGVGVNVQNAGLADVVLSVEGMSSKHKGWAPAAPVTVEAYNMNCACSPRVRAPQVGGVVEFRNEDPILPNTHITLEKRTFVNVALPAGSRPIAKPIKNPVGI